MAKQLTAEQRERANQRKRDARAAKRQAEAAPANRAEESQATRVVELLRTRLTARAAIFAAKDGDAVTSPRDANITVFVQKSFRLGGRFLTSDGEHVYADTCKHSEAERVTRGSIVYFEQVGEGNKDAVDGTFGFAHRFSRCNKVIPATA